MNRGRWHPRSQTSSCRTICSKRASVATDCRLRWWPRKGRHRVTSLKVSFELHVHALRNWSSCERGRLMSLPRTRLCSKRSRNFGGRTVGNEPAFLLACRCDEFCFHGCHVPVASRMGSGKAEKHYSAHSV